MLRQAGEMGFNLDVVQEAGPVSSRSDSIRVRLATDRAQVAGRLGRLLAATGRVEILTVVDPQSAQVPAVLLLDCPEFASPQRLRLQRIARSQFPARVLWYLDTEPTGDDAVQSVLDAVKLGWCHGYIAGDCRLDLLVRAISAVARHDIWLPRAMLALALSESRTLQADQVAPVAAAFDADRTLALLTMREREVLRQVRQGLTNKEVGRYLGIEEDTVKKHLRNMYAKLGVHRRAQMLLRAQKSTA